MRCFPSQLGTLRAMDIEFMRGWIYFDNWLKTKEGKQWLDWKNNKEDDMR